MAAARHSPSFPPLPALASSSCTGMYHIYIYIYTHTRVTYVHTCISLFHLYSFDASYSYASRTHIARTWYPHIHAYTDVGSHLTSAHLIYPSMVVAKGGALCCSHLPLDWTPTLFEGAAKRHHGLNLDSPQFWPCWFCKIRTSMCLFFLGLNRVLNARIYGGHTGYPHPHF